MNTFTESRSNSISCTPIVSQKELQRLTCLNRSSSPLSRFTKKLEQSPSSEMVHRYTRFTRHMAGGSGSGGSRTAPSSPETHKEEEAIAVEVSDTNGSPEPSTKPVSPTFVAPLLALPAPPVHVNRANPVLVHVADYVSSDCVDSVDSDDQQSLAQVAAEELDEQPFPESSDDELPEEVMTSIGSASNQVTASKSDGQIYRRRCEEFDVSTSSLNQQTQCCMSFKAHPKSSRKKSQSHSCHVV